MPRLMTSEDLLAMRITEEPQLSPDGTLIAYIQTEIDAGEYAYRRSIRSCRPPAASRAVSPPAPKTADRVGRPTAKHGLRPSPREEIEPKNADERDRGIGKPQSRLLRRWRSAVAAHRHAPRCGLAHLVA